jgi:hypothetical protein
MVDACVNATRLKTALYGMPLLFEVQIFGGVNIRNDVTDVYLAGSLDATIEQNVQAFFANTRVGVHRIDANAPAGRVYSAGGLTDFDALAMVLAGHGTDAERQAYETDSAQVPGQMEKAPYRTAYAMALYITHVASQGAGGLTAEDLALLRKTEGRMRAMAVSLAKLVPDKVPANVQQNLADRMQTASDALALAARQPVLVA